MKKFLLCIAVLISAMLCFSQSVVPIRGDTIKVYKNGGVSNLLVDGNIIQKPEHASMTDTTLMLIGVTSTGKYVWCTKSSIVGGIGTQGLQSVITFDPVLTKSDTIDLRGFQWRFRVNPYNSSFQDVNTFSIYANDTNRINMGSGAMRMIRSNFPDITFQAHARLPATGITTKFGFGYDTTGQSAYGGGGHAYIDMRDSVAVFVFESAGSPDAWFFTKYYSLFTGGTVLGYSGRGKVLIYGSGAPDFTNVGDAGLRKFNVYGTTYLNDTLIYANTPSVGVDTTTYKPLVRKSTGEVYQFSSWAGLVGGSPDRFGKAGEDALGAETRRFDANNGTFGILHTNTFEINTTNTVGAGKQKVTALSYSTNWGSFYASHDTSTSAFAGFDAISNSGSGNNQFTIGAWQSTGHNITLQVSDTAISAQPSSGNLPVYLKSLAYERKDTLLNYNPTTGKITYYESLQATGQFEPTLTSISNVTANTSYSTTKWKRNNDQVDVWGKFQVDPTGAGATELDMSLPIASNFTGDDDAAGQGSSTNITGEVLTILADATNDRVRVMWTATDTSNRTVYFHYSYIIK